MYTYIRLIGDLQVDFAKVRILLYMLTWLLPLPTSVHRSSHAEDQLVESALGRVRDILREVQPTLLAPSQDQVLTAGWSCEGLCPASQAAIDVMSYLENGAYDTDVSTPEGEGSEAAARPPGVGSEDGVDAKGHKGSKGSKGKGLPKQRTAKAATKSGSPKGKPTPKKGKEGLKLTHIFTKKKWSFWRPVTSL